MAELDRKKFLKLPMEKCREILAEQAKGMEGYYKAELKLLTDEEIDDAVDVGLNKLRDEWRGRADRPTKGMLTIYAGRATTKAQAELTAREILDEIERLFHSGNIIRPPEIYSMSCIHPEQWQQLRKQIEGK